MDDALEKTLRLGGAFSAPEVSDRLMPGRIRSHPRRENQLQLLHHGVTNGMLH